MTSDPPDPIAAAAARYKRDNSKAKASRQELAELVLAALREPRAEPVDIAKRAEWTPAYVRKLARDNDIQADADYKARTEKARARLIAGAASAGPPAMKPSAPSAVEAVPEHIKPPGRLGISPEVAALSYGQAKALFGRTEMSHLSWWIEHRKEINASDIPADWQYHVGVQAGVDAEIIDLPERPVSSEGKTG